MLRRIVWGRMRRNRALCRKLVQPAGHLPRRGYVEHKARSAVSRCPSMMSLDNLLTVKEVSALLRVSPQTLYKMLEQGCIPALRIGNQWRFERQRVLEWLERGDVHGG